MNSHIYTAKSAAKKKIVINRSASYGSRLSFNDSCDAFDESERYCGSLRRCYEKYEQ